MARRGGGALRALEWACIFAGFQSMLFFAAFWFDPDHPRQWVLFAPLSFAVLWIFYETGLSWTWQLAVKVPAHLEPEPGIEVDVFTTAAPGEPIAMFEKSLPALRDMRHPHRTWLLDGTGNPAFQALAEKLGIGRIDCRKVGGAKAGKVNHALSLTQGEIVLVLDPDHVVEPEFLDRVLGHFRDPEVGFVQVVQAYHNQGASWVARAAAEQTYGFYGPVQMGLNGLGAAIAIGANCTFRRKALESIGGHAVHLAEDLVTSMRLHSKGWKSVYVPEILARGLVPEDVGAYMRQQMKWACGALQALKGELPRRWWGLRGWQKLTYPLNGVWYLNGLASALTLLLPPFFLLSGHWAVSMRMRDFLLHLAPFAFLFLCVHLLLQRHLRHREEWGLQWRGSLLKLGTWHVYLLALLYTLAGKGVPYVPTAKTRSRAGALRQVWPSIAVAVAGPLAAISALTGPLAGFWGTHLMVGFACMNTLLLSPTIISALPHRRKHA
jgi:cellulose synthase (UDP-forming)